MLKSSQHPIDIFAFRMKMQDIENGESPKSVNEMSPYLGSKYESPISSRSPSPSVIMDTNNRQNNDQTKYISDDEISVGCPSPAAAIHHHHQRSQSPQDYQMRSPASETSPNYTTTQTPPTTDTKCRYPNGDSDTEDYFKPLKKLKMVETDRRISPTVEIEERPPDGVKSFSIADILNHKPTIKPTQCSRIVRPWDIDHDLEAQQRLESFHRHLKVQHLAFLRPEFAAFNASYTSETGSDRSSSVASDCCSPDIVTTPSAAAAAHRQRQQQQQQGKQPGATPLDALFQMTSKTFDSSAGESSAGKIFQKFIFSILSLDYGVKVIFELT